MRISREWLGGAEVIDLDTNEGFGYFVREVVQDEEVGIHYITRFRDGEDEIIVNANEPEYIERWTVLP